jgi:hypothetical protein
MAQTRGGSSDFGTWWQSQTGSRYATSASIRSFLRGRLGSENFSIPVDPTLHASRLGCAITIERIPAGRLEISSRRALIRLPAYEDGAKQRFVAAHELAHFLLLDETRSYSRPFRLSNLNVSRDRAAYVERLALERLCNDIARVMLIPPEILPDIPISGVTLQWMRKCATQFDVSVDLLFSSLADENRLSRHPGWLLLRYTSSEATRRDVDWRIVSYTAPRAEKRHLPWPNQSLKKLGINLPALTGPASGSLRWSQRFGLGARNWLFEVTDFEDGIIPTALAKISLVLPRLRVS